MVERNKPLTQEESDAAVDRCVEYIRLGMSDEKAAHMALHPTELARLERAGLGGTKHGNRVRREIQDFNSTVLYSRRELKQFKSAQQAHGLDSELVESVFNIAQSAMERARGR